MYITFPVVKVMRTYSGHLNKGETSTKEERRQVTEDDIEVKPKKQRLMTEYLAGQQEEVKTEVQS